MRPPAKPVEFIICFSDHTWVEDTFLVPHILWINKDKADVEDRLRDEIELKYVVQKSMIGGKTMVAYMLSWWGPEDEEK